MAFVGGEGFGVDPSSSQGTGEAVASSSPAGVFIGSTAPAAAASTRIFSGLGGIGGAGTPTPRPAPPAAGDFVGSTAPAAAASTSILSGLVGLGGLGAAAPAVSLGAPACGFAAAPAEFAFRPSSFDGGGFGFGGYAEFGGGMVGRAAQTDPTLEVLQQIQTRNPALITSLDFRGLGVLRASLLFPAIAHLTAMTYLNLSGIGLGSSGFCGTSGASHLCSALTYLTAMTYLNLQNNGLTADDGARICGAAAAAGMTRLQTLDVVDRDHSFVRNHFLSAADVVGCETWRQLNVLLPPLPDHFLHVEDFGFLVQYLASSDKAAFADAHHPDLPLELLRRIRTSDPALTHLQILHKSNFLEAGCRVLARALSLNTCITILDLGCTSIGDAGACLLFPAIAHLTAMTHLMLRNTSLGSSGASHLCSALTHLTAMTCLDLGFNRLTADDGARICGAAAAAGMMRLQAIELERNGFYSLSDVVECGAWELLNLPQPLGNVDYDSRGCVWGVRGCDCTSLVMYAIRLRYAVSLVLTAAATCPMYGLRRRSHVFQFQGPPQIIVHQRHQSSNGPGDDEERGIVDGESAFVHHLHPCVQIGFSMSRRSLDFAALQLWCHCNQQYLRLLICCCPLSTLAFRLARTSSRHDSQRMAQHRAAALVMRRCFSMLAWRIWTESTPSYPSFSVLL